MEKYTYNTIWSKEDNQFVGLCKQFPSLSFLEDTEDKALQGIKNLVKEIDSEESTEIQLYNIQVSESTLDTIHGFSKTIKEAFVPEYNLAFNTLHGIFKTDNPRQTPTSTAKVPTELIMPIIQHLNTKNKALESIDKVFQCPSK